MTFASFTFLFFYLPFVLVVMKLSPLHMRSFLLLLCSLFFYGWEEPYYILLMIFSTLFDYMNGYMVYRFRKQKQIAKRFVLLSIIGNLSILCFFKYYDYIVYHLQTIGISWLSPLHVTLPLGISFYTFQTMSYPIDVYRNQVTVEKNILTFGSYVTMFPQLVAGPIVRYADIQPQLKKPNRSSDAFLSGSMQFIFGLAKKVLLANHAGAIFLSIQKHQVLYPSLVSYWLMMIVFAFQLYYDFSGYSDMAIGLGRMLGYPFPKNFNYPYIAKSIQEFWQRWHMTLMSFFKDYLYIPLGGSKKGKQKTIRNIMIVWICSGLWHGANDNFLLWGIYCGACILLECYVWKSYLKQLPNWLQHTYTILFILVGWVFFAFEDLSQIQLVLSSMFGFQAIPIFTSWDFYSIRNDIVWLCFMIIGLTPLLKKTYRTLANGIKKEFLLATFALCCFVLSIASLVNHGYNPFLYFRF